MLALTAWCEVNNLSFNINKTKDRVVDFRRNQAGHRRGDGKFFIFFKFLGKGKWLNNTDTSVKARQRLFNLRMLKPH
jgi:hypothetical protein